MPIPWELTPLEVWMNIFDRVHSRKQLARCRLVCKRWDAPAERSMFRHQLQVKSSDKFMNSLLQHLEKKPALAQLIKSVELDGYYNDNRRATRKSLLRMIINPNIEELDVSNASATDLKLLVDILKTPGIKLDKVKTLRSPYSSSQASSDLRHLVRHSLENLGVNVADSFNKHDYPALKYLIDYKSLKSFSLSVGSISLKGLEQILRKLHSVSVLTLTGKFTVSSTEAALDQWLEETVQKVDHVQQLHVRLSSSQSDANSLMKYLSYKYPQLAAFTFNGQWSYGGNFSGIFPYITQIETISIPHHSFRRADDLTTIGHGLKSASNTIAIFYDPDQESTNMMKISKSNADNHSDFLVELTPHSSHEYFRKLLSAVSTEGSNIVDLSVDLVHCREASYDDEEDMDLYELLKMVPGIRKLEFSDESIRYNSEEELPTLHDLHTLEFCRTKVDPEVLSQISEKAPNLEHLTLASCLALAGSKLHKVALPTASLRSLTFRMKEAKWCLPDYDDPMFEDHPDLIVERPEMDELEEIDKTLRQTQAAYLHIKIKDTTDQYVLLKPRTKQAVLLAKEEFDMNSKNATIFYIECKSLCRLSVQLGGIHAILKFKDGKQLDDEGETLMLSGSLKNERSNQDLKTRYNALKQHMLTELNYSSTQIQEIENQAYSSLS